MQRREFIRLLSTTALAWPLTARGQHAAYAQQIKRKPRIGVLWHARDPEGEGAYYVAFHQGFRDLGYVDGTTIEFEERFANEHYDRFKSFAAELVTLNVDVLVCVTLPAALAGQAATQSIPIVFMSVPDPIGSKLVDSLAQPGGNITGLSNMAADIMTKRLQLLKEMVPHLSRAALLVNLNDPRLSRSTDEVEIASAQRGTVVKVYGAQAPADLEQVFDRMAQDGAQGVFTENDPMLFNERKRIADLAILHRLPLLFQNRPGADAGALMSYGPDSRVYFRRAPMYVDKILKGAKPSELPVEQPTQFEIVINLKTAKALGLDIPPTLLSRADDVIE
jgi:putative ABC transport system substrate-binding protein